MNTSGASNTPATAAPTTLDESAVRGGHSSWDVVCHYQREISVAIAYAVLMLVLLIRAPQFFHGEFAQDWVSAAPLLVAAIGMTLIILARQIDISIGAQFSACGLLAAMMAAHHWPLPIILICTLVAGAGLGAINGVLVAGAGLPAIVVTLATLAMLRGLLVWMQQGAAVSLPASFQWFGQSQAAGQLIIVAVAAAIFVVFALGLRYIAAGRAVYAAGSDPEAARLTGIRPRWVVFFLFTLMGILTATAASVNAARFAIVYPNYGDGLELSVIAAVVVGGTAITGGRGTLLGTLIGVSLLASIRPALVFLGAQPYWEKAIQGAIILVAVASDRFFRGER